MRTICLTMFAVISSYASAADCSSQLEVSQKQIYQQGALHTIQVFPHTIAYRAGENANPSALNDILREYSAQPAVLDERWAKEWEDKQFKFIQLNASPRRELLKRFFDAGYFAGIPHIDGDTLKLSSGLFVARPWPNTSEEQIEHLNAKHGVTVRRKHPLFWVFETADAQAADTSRIYFESGLFKYAEPEFFEIFIQR